MNVNFKDGAASVFGEIRNLAMTKCGHYTFSLTVPCRKIIIGTVAKLMRHYPYSRMMGEER